MFCFRFCFPKAGEAINSKMTRMTFQRINLVSNAIVHAKKLCSVNHKASFSKVMSAFSFISIGYLFIDLSSSTTEKVALPDALHVIAATRKLLRLKEFADKVLFYIYQ